MKRTTYILIGLFVAGLFQSNKSARRAANQRNPGLPGNMACSNGDAYRRM